MLVPKKMLEIVAPDLKGFEVSAVDSNAWHCALGAGPRTRSADCSDHCSHCCSLLMTLRVQLKPYVASNTPKIAE